ncbi:hypothetical protein [Hymenobacter terricola]|uniref:hypothetical protein n=1 Tax=Hymenobacter terricola TaxID=2819236 RepID=UPI001B310473|nr:hypothetical protein [Hymenobacter terricola]
MSRVCHAPERRMTKDLDLAVFINNAAQYEELQAWLIAPENFTLTRHSAFCLHYHAPGSPVSVAVRAIADEAGDVWNLVEGYFSLIADDIYAQHLDLFDENETATNFMLLVGGPVQTRAPPVGEGAESAGGRAGYRPAGTRGAAYGADR